MIYKTDKNRIKISKGYPFEMPNNETDWLKNKYSKILKIGKLYREPQKQENQNNFKGLLHEGLWIIYLKA